VEPGPIPLAAAETETTATEPHGAPPYPGMVWIPGGTFLMGSDKHYPEERPAHRVAVDGFWMDRTPVTNERFARFLNDTHVATLATGAALFILLRAIKRTAPPIPAPLVVVVTAIAAAYSLDLQRQGVAVVGAVPGGLPLPRVPTTVAPSELGLLALDACGIVLVSFCSMMPTARGFAAKNGYRIDANQDFIALGVSNLASGLGQGFVVSGADSRTAVGDAAGGKTQVTSLVAAVAIAAVLMFLTAPLAYLPRTARAASSSRP
jgi:MFS superfamily sulfate permease-like transporter